MFLKLYKTTVSWASKKHASWYLGAVSFAESSFFPIPPDVLLAPMCLAHPKQALRFAGLTTIASVLGGILGYLIGVLAFDLAHHWIEVAGLEAGYERVVEWFDHYGVWAIALAATITPIPYKLFTIGAGVLHMPLLPFILASLIGRASRFYLVAFLVKNGNQAIDRFMHQYADIVGWTILIVGSLCLVLL